MSGKPRPWPTTVEELVAIIKSDKFSRSNDSLLNVVHRELKRLNTEAQSITSDNFSRFKQEVEANSQTFWNLKLGGACEHGADKGPHCVHCKGRLKGRFTSCPFFGLDVLDYSFKTFIQQNLSESQREKILLQLDEIESRLVEVQKAEKQLRVEFEKLEKRITKQNERDKKRPMTFVSTSSKENSIEQVKKQYLGKSNLLTLQKSNHELEQELKNQKVSLTILHFDALQKVPLHISRADLDADFDGKYATSFDWFKCHVQDEIHKMTGRRIVFDHFETINGLAIKDEESLIDLLDLPIEQRILKVKTVLSVQLDSVERCFKSMLRLAERKEFPHLLDILPYLTEPLSSIRLVDCADTLPKEFLYSLAYRTSIIRLDLSFSTFRFIHLAECLSSLPALEVLKLPRRPNGKQTFKLDDLSKGLDVLVAANNSLPKLKDLDLSHLNMFNYQSEPLLVKFNQVLANFSEVESLSLNGVLSIPFGFPMDESQQSVFSSFLDQLFQSLALSKVKRLYFNHNCFVGDHQKLSNIFRQFLSGERSLELFVLRNCRVWTFLEDEQVKHSQTKTPLALIVEQTFAGLPVATSADVKKMTWDVTNLRLDDKLIEIMGRHLDILNLFG